MQVKDRRSGHIKLKEQAPAVTQGLIIWKSTYPRSSVKVCVALNRYDFDSDEIDIVRERCARLDVPLLLTMRKRRMQVQPNWRRS